MQKVSTFVVLLLAVTLFTEAKTIRVPQDHAKIQLAINAAVNGDTVLVAEDAYFENLVISKKIVLGSLYIMDKDTSHISKTIVDGSTPVHADSASVIRIFAGTDSTTVISGFTIRNGHGTKMDFPGTYDWLSGGGIKIFAGSAKITHNIITNNTLNSSLGVYGGGIAIDPVLGPIGYWVIEYNRIFNNNISSTSDAAEGAGVWMTDDGRFTNNEISNNVASSSIISAGGGVFLLPMPGYGTSTILIAGNIFRGNQAMNGGGFWMGAHTTLTPRPIVTLLNNLIIGNSGTSGSAMNILSGDFVLVNNTIVDNVAKHAIRLFAYRGDLTFRFLNNILWNSAADTQLTVGIGSTYVLYSCIQGGYVGTGNISADPLFVANDPLYRLSDSSPCIGAGADSALVGGLMLRSPLLDYYNTVRPRPAGTKPDMGAVENDRSTPLLGVKDLFSEIPGSFCLDQNYPNPFNPTTTIRYSLPSSAKVKLTIHDILGRNIATLVNEEQSAGWEEMEWDAAGFASGMYVVRMQANNFIETKKILLMK